ncbi:MAG: MBL fold metallo-hydrolase, partial [Deltaproteobacteria bacterium]|nr:MBL fold metallo-hydrolase [Deltaproteobacteria bacterium]
MITPINELDRVEILTLQDNCIDLTTRDDTEVLKRARPVKQSGEVNSIIAEHGFSTFVTVFKGEKSRSMLFDFGFSEFGAAYNAEALEVNLTQVEALALSHGHMDHYGGLRQLARLVGRTNLEFVVHPAAFRAPRYRKVSGDNKFYAPSLSRDAVEAAGCLLTETETPYPLLENSVLFLGAVPRRTGFEKGDANRFYEEKGEEKIDTVEEDTAIV